MPHIPYCNGSGTTVESTSAVTVDSAQIIYAVILANGVLIVRQSLSALALLYSHEVTLEIFHLIF